MLDIKFKVIDEEVNFDIENNQLEYPCSSRVFENYAKVFPTVDGEITESEEHVAIFKKLKESGLLNADEETLLEEFYLAISTSCDINHLAITKLMSNFKEEMV